MFRPNNNNLIRPLTRSKEDFRKFLSLQLQKATLSLDQKKKILTRFWRIWRIWRKIFARSAQTRCEPTKIFSTETLRVYLRVKIFFRGKKISSREKKLNFFSTRRNFLLARRNFSRNSSTIVYGQIKPGNGDSFSFRKSSFDLVRGLTFLSEGKIFCVFVFLYFCIMSVFSKLYNWVIL